MQQEGMVDPQGVGVLLGVQTDVGEGLDTEDISDTTTEQLLNNADSISVSPSEKESQKVGLVLPFPAYLQHCR